MLAQLLGLSGLLATPAAPDAPLAPLAKRLSRVASVDATFHQRRTLSALQDELRSDGTLSWHRGGKLVWHTRAPSESEVVLDEGTAVIRLPALHTEQSFDLKSQPQMAAIFRSILAVLRADLEALEKVFDVRVASPKPLSVDLAPKSPDLAAAIPGIHLTFDASFALTRVVLDEAGGDKTEISFSDQIIRDVSP
jgi:outer membrane lipoprotein-sorting protein